MHRRQQKRLNARSNKESFGSTYRALFERSPRFPRDSLTRFAARLGLDTARFEACLNSGKKKNVVLQDLQDGQRYGVTGTPTFFINGKIFVGDSAAIELRRELGLDWASAPSGPPRTTAVSRYSGGA